MNKQEAPKCCGINMYPCGGTVGEINENSVLYYRCSICGQELEDVVKPK